MTTDRSNGLPSVTQCQCGCGEPLAPALSTRRARGRSNPVRFLKGHRPRLLNPGHDVDPTTGCWLWRGYVNPRTGYAGMMQHEGQPTVAHRAYYLRRHGEIPSGFQLDHLCRTRRCVNPDHLEPVLPKVNVRRSRATRLTEEQIDYVRRSIIAGRGCVEVAREIGVSHSMVSMIVARKRWR